MKTALLELLTGRGALLPFLALGAVALLVFVVAARLAGQAETIARRTGLGGLWIGSALLAISTSLPEVLTGLNAALFDVPDIGVGDLLGAVLANMTILAILDLAYARRRILHAVATEHAILGLLGVVMAAITGLAVVVGGLGRLGHVGLETLAIGLVYAGGMRAVYRSAPAAPLPEDVVADVPPLGEALAGFGLGTLGLLALAPCLVVSAEALARESGVTATFVGTLLVGITTSLPELAATVSAVRLGALDLAAGNVFGSVAFNLVVLLLMDLVSLRAPILPAVSQDHALTAQVAIVCVALGVMAILGRTQRRPGSVRVESALVVVAYVLGVWMLYARGAS